MLRRARAESGKSSSKSGTVILESQTRRLSKLEEGENQDDDDVQVMGVTTDEEQVEEVVASPTALPNPHHPLNHGRLLHPLSVPEIHHSGVLARLAKSGFLVQAEAPDWGEPLRAMASRPRLNVDPILHIPIQLPLGELIDRSDVTVKGVAYAMQQDTPRYRVKEATKHEGNGGTISGINGTGSIYAARATGGNSYSM